MTGEPVVSVIVPVFNAQRHLEQCFDSLLGQTLGAVEIIAVDDASTDGSSAILKRLASDERVRVIAHPDNRGVSSARNTGLAAARGAYVAFVDADDLVAPTMYADLLGAARAQRADIAMCGIRMIDAEGRIEEIVPPPLRPGVLHTQEAVREALHSAWATRLLWYPVRSIYSRDLLTVHHVEFDPGIRKGEDSLFNLKAVSLADRVTAVDGAHYSYRKHPGSATARPLPSESTNLQRLGDAVLGFYEEHGFDERARRDFYRHVLRSDLPTALVRVGNHEDARSETDALLRVAPVRQAFRSERLSRLGVPLSVTLLLFLAKHRLTVLILVAVRLSAALKRLRRG